MSKNSFIALNKNTLAALYGISEKTLSAWFEDQAFKQDFGEYLGKTFTPKQLKVIANHFGPWKDCPYG